ncbi:hypothetical protein JCM10213_007911 [Rhodosporidiobolus nylandii]
MSKPTLRHLETEQDLRRESADSGTVVGGGGRSGKADPRQRQNALLSNPLINKSEGDLFRDVDDFVERNPGLADIRELLYKAALVAQDRDNFERLPQLSEEEKQVLREEKTHRFRQSKMLYYQIFMCSMGAVVQGVRLRSIGREGWRDS